MKSNSKGFTLVEGLIIVVVIGFLVFAGWTIYSNQDNDAAEDSTTTTQQSQEPEVNSEEDLEAAEVYLNEQNIEEQLDTSEIDEALAE